MTRLAALSVDLDEVYEYAAIHGLDVPRASRRAIYEFALPRFEAFFAELGVPATFFVIGRDVDGNEAALKRLVDAGHELGNHTQNHRYDLSRLTRPAQASELSIAKARIEAASGGEVVGFRAPGYVISETTFEVLEAQGYRYDSSVFPCPAYYGAKNLAIGLYGLRAALGKGKASQSLVDVPQVLKASPNPYRRGRPYWTKGQGIVELPIAVTRGLRLPFIGTSVALAKPVVADTLAQGMIGRPFVNLEMHGIDLSDADEDGLKWLAPHQPDLRRSAADKWRSLETVVRRLQGAGYRFVTLAEAAEHFG